MTPTPIPPAAALALVEKGALLIDIRGADEYAREHIAQARHVPLERLAGGARPFVGAGAVVFHCLSGARTGQAARTLAACTDGEAYVLDGGLQAWKRAGLPVVADRSLPLPLNRQVQIAAGSIVLAATVLGATVWPWLHAVAALAGAGLVFAGVSGDCGLARLLMKMPWNRDLPAA